MPAPLPRHPRYDSLDFWRGLACLLVVMYHSVLVYVSSPASAFSPRTTPVLRAIAGLWIGVPLFFVISGYCIAATADRTRLRGDGLGSYFLRRFRRIYPPLWIVIVVSVAFFVVVDVAAWPGILSNPPWAQYRPWWYSPWQWLGNLTLTETWRHHVVGGPRGHFPGQAWTLCYEEQFYMVVGALLLFPRYFFRGTIAVTAFTFGAMWAAQRAGWGIDGFFFDGNWLMFAAGILVYYAVNYATRAGQWWACALLVGAACFGTALLAGSAVAFVFAAALIPLKGRDRQLASAAVARPIIFCGQMCYSLYLVHQLLVRAISAGFARAGLVSGPATLFVTLPVCVAASVLAGYVFYQLVERRFLNAPRPEPREAPAAVLAAQPAT